MSPLPKIYKQTDIDILRDAYLDKKMSTTEISKSSQDIFGFYISSSSIYTALIKHDIDIRNKSESISLRRSRLDSSIVIETEKIIEWIDGFNLGDGYINFEKHTYRGARYVIGSVEKEWTEYAMSGLKDYLPSNAKQYGKIRIRAPRLSWSSITATHLDIVQQAKRWYPAGKKQIPKDIRITPISLLLWYLGDGSITNQVANNAITVQFATCSFKREDLENILIPKMAMLELKCRINSIKNDLVICSESIGQFFNIIGLQSPIKCYEYKYNFPQWLKLYRLSEIVKNDQEKWRAQYLYKQGKLNCSKSPGGKMFVFTEQEANELREKLGHPLHTIYTIDDFKPKTIDQSLIKLSSIVKTYQQRWNARYFMSHKLVEFQKGSYFTESQAKILKDKITQYGENDAIPTHVVSYHFRKARADGFPYYELNQEQFDKGIQILINCDIKKDDGMFAWAGHGSELATYFHPHIFECKRRDKLSAIELYQSDEDFRRAIWKIVALSPKITPSKIREICRNEKASSRINQFPPRVMMAILKELYPRGDITLLDPTHGFSGRLLGCYASKLVSKYIGIDASEKTHLGAIKTKEWLRNIRRDEHQMDIQLINDDCLINMDNYNDIDFIFTSPPFLDVERYVGVDFEIDYNKWINDFIKPFCIKSLKCLKQGGQLGVYLEKIDGHDFRDDFRKIALEVGFKSCPSILFKMSYGENTRDKKSVRGVPILVFKN